jgi:glutathione S-transferase
VAEIYHCATIRDWQTAQGAGEYTNSSRGRTLDEEGFIHLAFADQIRGVLQRYYADLTEPLCLLVVDPERAGSPVVEENLMGGGELFPHLYGPLPVSAVLRVDDLVRESGGWSWPGH